MNQLAKSISFLKNWQIKNAPNTKSRCLESVRASLKVIGKSLPMPMSFPNNTALANFKELVKDPAKYGWRQIHFDEAGKLEVPCLVYFKNCGILKDGRVAGHIAIYDGVSHHANTSYKMTKSWKSKIVGAFVPV